MKGPTVKPGPTRHSAWLPARRGESCYVNRLLSRDTAEFSYKGEV
jgi:hypothetical protein